VFLVSGVRYGRSSVSCLWVWVRYVFLRRSEAGARWPGFGLVVVATTSCRNNKVQMIRPLELYKLQGKKNIIGSTRI
jgi:hypothetical protein